MSVLSCIAFEIYLVIGNCHWIITIMHLRIVIIRSMHVCASLFVSSEMVPADKYTAHLGAVDYCYFNGCMCCLVFVYFQEWNLLNFDVAAASTLPLCIYLYNEQNKL